MKTQKDKLDKLFQSKLENLKIPAPEGTWEDIEVKLDKKKRKKVFFLWRSTAAAVILLLISIAFYWSYSDFPVEHLEVVENYNEKQSDAIEKKTDLKKTKQKETLSESQEKNHKAIVDEPNPTSLKETKTNFKETPEQIEVALQEPQLNPSENISKTQNENYSSSRNSLKDLDEKLNLDVQVATDIALHHQETLEELNVDSISNSKIEEDKEVALSSISLKDSHLFDEEREKNIEQSDEKKQGKWAIGPLVAPVYYNSISNGSSLDEQFNNNQKEGGYNMSVGVQVTYQINENWQLRSGINKMNVGYATNNVQVGYSDPNLGLRNVNYTNSSNLGEVVVTAFSTDNLYKMQAEGVGSRIEVLSLSGNTQLKQNMTYLEVPLEIERKIIQSNFELSVIGGVSSLFLADNNISINNKDYIYDIGDANNLEKTSFTTNIGMGFGYNFNKNIYFQLEPMFKYQLNAYRNSVDFKPYIFGVYTGINWKLD